MNYRMICRVLGWILLIYAALMLLPLAAGLWYGENVLNFIIAIGITGSLGGLLLIPKPRTNSLVARDGFVIVGLGWIGISLLGALPFVLSGSIPRYVDALFETASGLSTTGASVVTDIGGMAQNYRGDMFWRLFNHWIGGMGVLVFLMAVLPMSGEHSMHIMRAEVPGPTVGKLVPRAKKTARVLYLIYIGLTLTETLLLLCGGMSFYEALVHSFSTAGTGGFSTNPASVGGFGSRYIETVITVFMLLFGVNFNLYFLVLMGHWKEALKSEELRWYLVIIFGSAILLSLGIYKLYGSLGETLHQAFFNVATLLSTTRRQHRRRHQGLPLDHSEQERTGGTAADDPAPQCGPSPAGRQAGGAQHREGRDDLFHALYGPAAAFLLPGEPGRGGHPHQLHRGPQLPFQHRPRHDPGHRPGGRLCLLL